RLRRGRARRPVGRGRPTGGGSVPTHHVARSDGALRHGQAGSALRARNHRLDDAGGAAWCAVLRRGAQERGARPRPGREGRVRQEVIRRLGAQPTATHAFAWVVDFPLFEPDPETGKPVFAHHPFTAPHPDDLPLGRKSPFEMRALHYDVVYNGNELGSGSIRITDRQVQYWVFHQLGLSDDEIAKRFGFLIDGLNSGAPPHGGFAIGFDRVVMLLAGAASLRDVIAFPKTTAARALFEGAPAP